MSFQKLEKMEEVRKKLELEQNRSNSELEKNIDALLVAFGCDGQRRYRRRLLRRRSFALRIREEELQLMQQHLRSEVNNFE